MDTKGNSPGAMSYMVKQKDRWLAFTGDLMLDGSRLHNWFDSEWDYGFAKGIHALFNSAGLVAGFDPALMLPSHGPTIKNAREQLLQYQKKLRHLEKLLVRGYPAPFARTEASSTESSGFGTEATSFSLASHNRRAATASAATSVTSIALH